MFHIVIHFDLFTPTWQPVQIKMKKGPKLSCKKEESHECTP